MTLNRMYHCVPRIISGLSQISGLSFTARCPTPRSETAGWPGRRRGTARSAEPHAWRCGRRPTQTPIGTQKTLASAISTTTRSSVIEPEQHDVPTSASEMSCDEQTARSATARRTRDAKATTLHRNEIQPLRAGVVAAAASAAVDALAAQHDAAATADANGAVQPVDEARAAQHVEHPGVRRDAAGSCSKRKRSAQATSGRNSS